MQAEQALECFQASVRDPGLTQVKLAKGGQAGEVLEPGVGDSRLVEIKLPQVGQAFQGLQSGVRDGCVGQPQLLEPRKRFDMRQYIVRYPGATQDNAHDRPVGILHVKFVAAANLFDLAQGVFLLGVGRRTSSGKQQNEQRQKSRTDAHGSVPTQAR